MVLTALRGALGFLTRLPVGHDEAAWDAFRSTPAVFPLAGYVVGTLLAVPLVLPLPAPTVAVGFLAWLVALTGINHLDGVADLGDAAAVHGGPEKRVDAMKDTDVGVGAVVAVGVVLAGLVAAGWSLAGLRPVIVAGVVVASEVGTRTGMAAIACFGEARHEGIGSAFTDSASPKAFVPAVLVALPAVALTAPWPTALAAFLAALAGSHLVRRWADRRLGGVSGDVFGAAAEAGRVVGLHAGVVAWTLW